MLHHQLHHEQSKHGKAAMEYLGDAHACELLEMPRATIARELAIQVGKYGGVVEPDKALTCKREQSGFC